MKSDVIRFLSANVIATNVHEYINSWLRKARTLLNLINRVTWIKKMTKEKVLVAQESIHKKKKRKNSDERIASLNVAQAVRAFWKKKKNRNIRSCQSVHRNSPVRTTDGYGSIAARLFFFLRNTRVAEKWTNWLLRHVPEKCKVLSKLAREAMNFARSRAFLTPNRRPASCDFKWVICMNYRLTFFFFCFLSYS